MPRISLPNTPAASDHLVTVFPKVPDILFHIPVLHTTLPTLSASGDLGGLGDYGGERFGVEAGASDEGAVNVGLANEGLNIVGVHAAAIETWDGIRRVSETWSEGPT